MNKLNKKALIIKILLWVALWIPLSFIFPGGLAIYAPVLAFIEILVLAKEGDFISNTPFTEVFLPCLIFWGTITLVVMQEKNKLKTVLEKHVIWAIIIFTVSFLFSGFMSLFIVILIAGPHTSMVPHWVGVIIFLLGTVFTFTVPTLLAIKVYKNKE